MNIQMSEEALEESLETAEVWAVEGYNEESRAYWTGMRDTLRVILGKTVRGGVMVSTDDPAAFTMFGAEARS